MKKAFVVGGGVAGFSAAIGLAQSGINVSLFERRSGISDRVCGAFCSPEAMRHLKDLGIGVSDLGGVVVKQANLFDKNGRSFSLDLSDGQNEGYALTRPLLEKHLYKMARNLGVEINWDKNIKSFDFENQHYCLKNNDQVVENAGDYLVLADGRFSLMNQRVFRRGRGWFGWNATFDGVNQKPGDLSLHFVPGGYIGCLTFANGQTNLCALVYRNKNQSKKPNEMYHELFDKLGSLKSILKKSNRLSNWRSVGPLPFGRTKPLKLDSLFLSGDAALVGDPFFGEGIGRALSTGHRLRALSESNQLNSQLYHQGLNNDYWWRQFSSRGIRSCLKSSFLQKALACLFFSTPKKSHRRVSSFIYQTASKLG